MRAALVVLILWLLVPNMASAHEDPTCPSSARCDEGRAYAAIQVAPLEHCQALRGTGVATSISIRRRATGSNGDFIATFNCRDTANNNQYAYQATHNAFFYGLCSSRPYETGWKSQPGGGSSVCHEGCAYTSGVEAGTPNGYSFDPTGATCKKDDMSAPEPVDQGEGGGGGDGGGSEGGGDGSDGGDPGGGGGDGGGGNGDGDGDGDGDGGPGEGGPGEGDGDGDGDGEGDDGDYYPGDVPMPIGEAAMPGSPVGQWSSGLGNGSCPASRTVGFSLGGYGASAEFSFKPFCDLATSIRSIALACATIIAAYIVAGVRK